MPNGGVPNGGVALLAIVLLQLAGGGPDPVPSMLLEVDGRQFGAFANLVQGKQTPPVVTLQQGRLDAAFLKLWWSGLTAEDLATGKHERDAGTCKGRRVDVRQPLALGRPGRQRSWALMDACPVSWEIEGHADQDGSLVVKSLSLSVTGVAAEM